MWGKKFWGKEIWWIAAGTFLMAVAVNLVYEPLEMVPGGISGAAILIQKLTERWIPGGIPVWSLNFILNIPIFIWGITVKGKTQEQLIDDLYTEMAEFSFLTKYIFGTGIKEIDINSWRDIEIQYNDGRCEKLEEHFESRSMRSMS